MLRISDVSTEMYSVHVTPGGSSERKNNSSDVDSEIGAYRGRRKESISVKLRNYIRSQFHPDSISGESEKKLNLRFDAGSCYFTFSFLEILHNNKFLSLHTRLVLTNTCSYIFLCYDCKRSGNETITSFLMHENFICLYIKKYTISCSFVA